MRQINLCPFSTVSVPPHAGLTGYFTLLDFFNQSKPTCVTSLEMKKLTKSILPKLKLIAYGRSGSGGSGAGDISNASSAPVANLHLFFPSYLSRVDTTGPLKGEFLASLVECLVQDPKGSFSVWRELYIKHLPQSGTLLKHLVDNQVRDVFVCLLACSLVCL